MTNEKSMADAGVYGSAHPIVHKIALVDLKDALVKGFADFNAMPTHLIFLCLIYPIVTLVFARVYAGYDVLWLVFPLLAGYTLVGPVLAVGMYELSRRREGGLDCSRWHLFSVLRSPSVRAIATLGVILMVVYFAWLAAAWGIYVRVFGAATPGSLTEFASQVLTTPSGWTLIAVGSGVGLVSAIAVLSLSVVSFPMLLDRDVGVWTAVVTSINAVLANPIVMVIWGLIVAYALLMGSLPFFVGLAVVLPVLGHATWHMYRAVVEF